MTKKLGEAADSKSAQGKPGASGSTTKGAVGKSRTAGKTKTSTLLKLLSRPQGATIEQMTKATGWQAHSVRGFMSGTVRKKLGHAITSEAGDSGRVYRVFGGTK